jgi:plastocyanin
VFGVLVAALLLLGACGGDDDEPAEEDQTTEQEEPAEEPADEGGGENALSAIDNSFEPRNLEFAAGEEVTVSFTNDGQNPHTFTSEEGDFDSGTIDPGDSKDVTFTVPEGTIDYMCTIHGVQMSGTIEGT